MPALKKILAKYHEKGKMACASHSIQIDAINDPHNATIEPVGTIYWQDVILIDILFYQYVVFYGTSQHYP